MNFFKKIGILLATSMLMFSMPSFAKNPLDQTSEQIKKPYTYIQYLEFDANQGDAGAQHELGLLYSVGAGVNRDDAKAIKYYTLAANQGHAQAQLALGMIYEEGRGVPQDDAKAVEYLTLAANQGDEAAQYGLGLMYADGRGVKRDYTKARHFFRKACTKEIDYACLALKKLELINN